MIGRAGIALGIVTLALGLGTPVNAQETPKELVVGTAPIRASENPLLVAQASGGAPAMSASSRYYVTLDAEVEQLQRNHDFAFGTSVSTLTTPSGLSPLSADINGKGGAGAFTVGAWVTDRLAVEFGFGMAQIFNQTNFSPTGGRFAVGSTVPLYPVIDGGIGTGGVGGPSGAAVLFGGGANGPGTSWSLQYTEDLYDVNMGARFRLWGSADRATWVDVVGGLAYTHGHQSFDHDALGNTFTGVASRISTSIGIADDLIGARLGARGQYRFGGAWSVAGGAYGTFSYRTSSLYASQNFTNPVFVNTFGGSNAFASSTSSFRTHVSDSNTGFVPAVNANLSLNYDLNDSLSIGVLYQFRAMFNMTRVDAPQVSSNNPAVSGRPVVDHPLRLKDDDRIIGNFAGVQATLKF